MEIIGKRKTVEYFVNAVKRDTLHHFYVIEGPKGVGKKTLVRNVARMIHCTGENKPCGVCPACVKHLSSNHPDFIVVSENSNKGNMSVETVRHISEEIFVKPLLADRKIYLVDDSKPLGADAQNAFLKILEEPPAYAVIFLSVLNSKALLPTVLSRALVMRVDPCTKDETVHFLRTNFPNEGNAELIAELSGGILGTAKNMAQGSEYFEARRELYDILSKSGSALILGLDEYFAKNKENVSRTLNLLLSWLRDAICLKNGGRAINYDFESAILQFSQLRDSFEIMKIADAAFDMCQNFKKGNNLPLWAANLLTEFS